ncbi:PEBP-like protein, partial [Lojkania enalia]
DASKPAPSLSIPSKIVNPSAKYIAIALDPDAPFPSMPLLGPVLHWIQTDLTTDDDADDDGWIKLTSSAKAVVYWGPPGPPPISAPHRYVFLVWEQPKDLTNEQARTSLGLPEEVGLRSRVRWNQEDCEKILGLGQVLGGNYFV